MPGLCKVRRDALSRSTHTFHSRRLKKKIALMNFPSLLTISGWLRLRDFIPMTHG